MSPLIIYQEIDQPDFIGSQERRTLGNASNRIPNLHRSERNEAPEARLAGQIWLPNRLQAAGFALQASRDFDSEEYRPLFLSEQGPIKWAGLPTGIGSKDLLAS